MNELAAQLKEAGITQAQVADAWGITQPNVSVALRQPLRLSLDRWLALEALSGGRITMRGFLDMQGTELRTAEALWGVGEGDA